MKIEILQPLGINELGSRQNQEDTIWPAPQEAKPTSRLFLLCDGMGGHDHGEVASRLVCDVLSTYLQEHWSADGVLTDEVLQDAIDEVFRKINALDNGSMRQMGTTLTLLALHSGGVTMAHIGDSRIYHLRPSEHRILYKTRDHSLAYDLFLAGELTFDEMAHYSKKNVITRAIMPSLDRQPRMDIAHTTDVHAGDYFLLCSDGLLEHMDDRQLVSLLCADSSDESKRKQMIAQSKDNADNHSAWLIHIAAVTPALGDAQQVNNESTIRSNAMLYEAPVINSKPSSFFGKILRRLWR